MAERNNNAITARLEAELARERREKALVQRACDIPDLAGLLDFVWEEINRTGGVWETTERSCAFDGYMAYFLDEEGANQVCYRAKMPSGNQELERAYYQMKIPLSQNDPITEVTRSKKPRIITREMAITTYKGSMMNRIERWDLESLVSMPIFDAVEPIGAILLMRRQGTACEQDLVSLERLLHLFGRPLKMALRAERVVLRERSLKSAFEEYQRFLTFITEINNLTRLESIYEKISSEFIKRFDFDMVTVQIANGDWLDPVHTGCRDASFQSVCEAMGAYHREHPYRLDQNDGATPTAFLHNTPFYFDDAQKIAHLPMSNKDRDGMDIMNPLRTVAIVPIRVQDKAIGVLAMVTLSKVITLSEGDKELIDRLCGFIGTAIGNARMYSLVEQQKDQIAGLNKKLQRKVRKLDDLASTDRLTGLANFGTFEKELPRLIAEHRQTGEPLAMVMLDVDHFKPFNDTYGHEAGNVVLREVGQRLQLVARERDLPCRYGGEEFVTILPGSDIQGALSYAERARRAIEQTVFLEVEGHPSVTISAGCAVLRPEDDKDSLFERVDKALYRAKDAGRNRVDSLE